MGDAQKRPLKRWLTLALKVAVSGGLLAWVLIYVVDVATLPDVLAKANPRLLALAFLLNIPGLVLSSLRWRMLLARQNVHVPLWPLIDSWVVAGYYNLLLPTRIGGDVARVHDLRDANKSVAKSASIVVVERLLGIGVLFAFATVAALIRLPLAGEIAAIPVALALGVSGLLGLVAFIYFDVASMLLKLLPAHPVIDKLGAVWQRFHANAVTLLRDKRALTLGVGYSLVLQVNVVIHSWLIGMSLGFAVPLLDYFFLIPVQLVILLLPTINGLGLRETSSIALFGFYGIGAAEALTFSLIELFFMVLLFVAGWIRLVMPRSLPTAAPSPARD